MKNVRFLLLFVGLIGVAAVAEAQCYTCRNLRPMPWYQGACIEGMPGVCSSQCCWQVYGAPCTLPDNDLWYCFSDPEGAMVVAHRYFTGAGLQQNNVLATVRKAGTLEVYRLEVMKRRIPRRCPSTT